MSNHAEVGGKNKAGFFGGFDVGSIFSMGYESIPGTGMLVKVNKNGTISTCEPVSSPFGSGVRNCKTTTLPVKTRKAVSQPSTEKATLAKWTDWDQANPSANGAVNAGNPGAFDPGITGPQVGSLDGKGPQAYTSEAVCKAAGIVSIVPPTNYSAKDWATWTALTPGLTAVGKAPVSVLKSIGGISTTVGIYAAPLDVFCRLAAWRSEKKGE